MGETLDRVFGKEALGRQKKRCPYMLPEYAYEKGENLSVTRQAEKQ
jgi:hypothetical protein